LRMDRDAELVGRFELGDPKLAAFFAENGYAVVANSGLEQDWHAACHALLWDFLEDRTEGWRREDPATWTDDGLGLISACPDKGLVNKRGAGQNGASWLAREKCAPVFAELWGTQDLLASFDGVGLFRPWHAGVGAKTTGGWFHVDQGPDAEPPEAAAGPWLGAGPACVQGFVSLFDQDAKTGGFWCVPGSHRKHDELLPLHRAGHGDYIQPPQDHPLLDGARLVQCQAGDLVLWDSRTLHCNQPATEPPTAPADRLLRAVLYVCLTPKRWASAEDRQVREQGYEMHVTTSHWPHKNCFGFGWGRTDRNSLADASPERRALIS